MGERLHFGRMGRLWLRAGSYLLLLLRVIISSFSDLLCSNSKYSPGRVSALAVGQVLANASLAVLNTGPSMGTMFWNL
jgi:hypothetical protein